MLSRSEREPQAHHAAYEAQNGCPRSSSSGSRGRRATSGSGCRVPVATRRKSDYPSRQQHRLVVAQRVLANVASQELPPHRGPTGRLRLLRRRTAPTRSAGHPRRRCLVAGLGPGQALSWWPARTTVRSPRGDSRNYLLLDQPVRKSRARRRSAAEELDSQRGELLVELEDAAMP